MALSCPFKEDHLALPLSLSLRGYPHTHTHTHTHTLREKEQRKKQAIVEALNLGLENLETFYNTYNMYIESGSE